MKKSKIVAGLTFACMTLMAATSAHAKDSKTINQTIDFEQGQQLTLKVPVGTLDIQTCDCNEVSVKVKVQSSKDSWSLFSSNDVDIEDIELKVKKRSSKVVLEVDKEDTKQRWTVTLPKYAALNIQMGVGDIEINDFNNDLEAEIGVGNIDVAVNSENYDQIVIEAGVGGTAVDGFSHEANTKRAMVSSKTRYNGSGNHQIDIDVGVGDAQVSKG